MQHVRRDGEEDSYDLDDEYPEEFEFGIWDQDEIDAIDAPPRGIDLVDWPEMPEQPALRASRIVIVSVIAILFAVALVLLGCAVLIRLLGL